MARLERDCRSAIVHSQRAHLSNWSCGSGVSTSNSRSPCSTSRTIVMPGPISRKISPAGCAWFDFERGENREVLISMNDPLRYRGFTFYQAGFDNNDKTTILQVVKNPAMLLPYIACGLVALGLLDPVFDAPVWLCEKEEPMKQDRPIIIWLIVAATLAYVVAPLFQHDRRRRFRDAEIRPAAGLAERPDQAARHRRAQFASHHSRQTNACHRSRRSLTPMDWLAEVMMKPDEADLRKIFVIRNPETLTALGLSPEAGKYFSFRELAPAFAGDRAAGRARGKGGGTTALAFSARHHQVV